MALYWTVSVKKNRFQKDDGAKMISFIILFDLSKKIFYALEKNFF